MLIELLQGVVTLAQQAANPSPHVICMGGRRSLHYINGDSKEYTTEPPALIRRVTSVSSLIEIVKQFGGSTPTVFVGDNSIECLLDDDDRQESVALHFVNSPQFQALQELGYEQGASQRRMIRLLRTTLRGTYSDEKLIDVFRRIDFKRLSDGSSVIERGKESLGKRVEMEVNALDDLPDKVIFDFNPFTCPDSRPRISVTYAHDVNVEDQRFSFVPVGNELDFALDQARKDIVDEIASAVSADTLVVQGSFSRKDHVSEFLQGTSGANRFPSSD